MSAWFFGYTRTGTLQLSYQGGENSLRGFRKAKEDLRNLTKDSLRTFLRIAHSKFLEAGFEVPNLETWLAEANAANKRPEKYNLRVDLTNMMTLGFEVRDAIDVDNPYPRLFIEQVFGSLEDVNTITNLLFESIHEAVGNLNKREVFYGEEALAERYKPSRVSYVMGLDDEALFNDTYGNYETRGPNAGKKGKRSNKRSKRSKK